jgi:hypothetical protein
MMWRILEQLRQHSRLTHRSLSVLQTIHVRIVQTRYELVPQLELDKKYMQLDGGDFLLRERSRHYRRLSRINYVPSFIIVAAIAQLTHSGLTIA